MINQTSANRTAPRGSAVSAAAAIAQSVPGSTVTSSLQLYMNAIGLTPLLTADDEKELGWKILNEGCVVSRERMVRANLRLVVAIAKNFVGRGLTLADLIAEGNIGLLHAVDGFDPAHGVRFSTYSSWWIKAAIKRAVIHAKQLVHIPAYMVELIGKWKAWYRKLEIESGSAPTMQDLAFAMNLPVKKVRVIRFVIAQCQSQTQMSGTGKGDLTLLSDVISDSREEKAEDRIFRAEELEMLSRLLGSIDSREGEILRLRFGLDGCDPLTLRQISEKLSISGERVRQIEEEALKKLNTQMSERHDAQGGDVSDDRSSAPVSAAPALNYTRFSKAGRTRPADRSADRAAGKDAWGSRGWRVPA